MISVASRQQQLNGNNFFERNVFTEQSQYIHLNHNYT